jgi:predicted nucleic acid-binding protein
MRYLLDTSALVAHFRQEAGWQDVQAIFTDSEAELVVASVSLTEFGRRIRTLGAGESEAEEILSSYQMLFSDVVSIDTVVARIAFILGCRTPDRLPLVDALIAAAALSREAVLVHRDEHMRQIPPELVHQRVIEANDGPT